MLRTAAPQGGISWFCESEERKCFDVSYMTGVVVFIITYFHKLIHQPFDDKHGLSSHAKLSSNLMNIIRIPPLYFRPAALHNSSAVCGRLLVTAIKNLHLLFYSQHSWEIIFWKHVLLCFIRHLYCEVILSKSSPKFSHKLLIRWNLSVLVAAHLCPLPCPSYNEMFNTALKSIVWTFIWTSERSKGLKIFLFSFRMWGCDYKRQLESSSVKVTVPCCAWRKTMWPCSHFLNGDKHNLQTLLPQSFYFYLVQSID